MTNYREHILKESKTLFANYGYANVTMREIIRTCAVPTGSLYKHFKNKDDILYHLRLSEIDRMVAYSIEKAGNEPLLILAFHLHHLFAFIQENERYAEALFKPNHHFHYHDGLSPKLTLLEKQCFGDRVKHYSEDDHERRSIIIQGIIENVANHFFNGYDSDLEELEFLVIQTIYHVFELPDELIKTLMTSFKDMLKAGI